MKIGMHNSKKILLTSLIIATILLVSCPMPDPPPPEPEPDLPAAPENLTFTARETTVTLMWNEVTDAESYRVYRGGERVGSDITVLTYMDTGLTSGTAYSYAVRAVKDNIESTNSNEVTATPDTPPAVPDGLTATLFEDGVRLSWIEDDDATSYRIYRDRAVRPLATSEPITMSSYIDRTVVSGSTYSYTVRALNGNLESGDSDPPTTVDLPTAVPANLRVVNGDEQVTLIWDPVERAVSYHIAVGAGEHFATIAHPTTTHTVTGLINGAQYNYTVKSSGNNGVESAPGIISAFPFRAPTLRATAGDGMVVLEWDVIGVIGTVAYRIYRNGNTMPLVTTPETITGTTYTDNDVDNGMEYTYIVQAVNAANRLSPLSNEETVTPSAPPGIPEDLVAALENGVTLTWTAVTGAAGYHVYRGTDQLTTDPIAEATYIDTSFLGSTTYSYTVLSVNAAGVESLPSDPASAIVPVINFDNLPVAGNADSRGIWSNGTTMWVADTADNKIYAYTLASEARDPAEDFNTLDDAGNITPQGIWSNGTTMWVTDFDNARVYAYNMMSKARDESREFGDDLGLTNLTGIWSNNTTMWVLRHAGNKIYAYQMSGYSRDTTKDVPLAAGNTNPAGIWSDDGTMWVSDSTLDRIIAYNLESGNREMGNDFNSLNGANNNAPLHMWSNDNTMWVMDRDDDRIYAYDRTMPGRPLIP